MSEVDRQKIDETAKRLMKSAYVEKQSKEQQGNDFKSKDVLFRGKNGKFLMCHFD